MFFGKLPKTPATLCTTNLLLSHRLIVIFLSP